MYLSPVSSATRASRKGNEPATGLSYRNATFPFIHSFYHTISYLIPRSLTPTPCLSIPSKPFRTYRGRSSSSPEVRVASAKQPSSLSPPITRPIYTSPDATHQPALPSSPKHETFIPPTARLSSPLFNATCHPRAKISASPSPTSSAPPASTS